MNYTAREGPVKPMRLLLILLGAILTATLSPVRLDAAEPAVTDSSAQRSAGKAEVVVYYLYKLPRCQTCLNIEAYAREAIETAFAAELQSGRVEWYAYDTDEPGNEHYWSDFKLELKALIMVRLENGEVVRWKNCERIWDLVEDKPAFLSYVQAEVRGYLQGS